MDFVPVQLGPFLVDADGRLSFRKPDAGHGFSFVWRGLRFAVKLGSGNVTIRATVARIPSTATMSGGRAPAFAALQVLPALLPTGWTLNLAADHGVQIEASEPMQWPTSTVGLFQPLIRLLLCLAPYLDLFSEIGFGLEHAKARA